MNIDTIDSIGSILAGKSQLSREDHLLCRALIDTLNGEEIKALTSKYELDWHLSSYIEERTEGKHEPRQLRLEHNKDWHVYFDELKKRKVGRIRVARERIHEMFYFLKWSDQLQVLKYSLHNGLQVDRIWALQRISDHWELISDCRRKDYLAWLADIEAVWNEHHDKDCAYIILRYLSMEVVAKYADGLADQISYKAVALRLGKNPDYVVQKERLESLDYLFVMARLGRTVSREEAQATLLEAIQDVIEKAEEPIIHRHTVLSLVSDDKVALAIWSLGQMKYPDLIMNFSRINSALQASLRELLPTDTDESRHNYWTAMCEKAKEYFPVREPKKSEEVQPKEEKTIVDELIEIFQLDTDDFLSKQNNTSYD